MTKLLLASLRIEYETTSITLDSLCHKHKVKLPELKGSSEWQKRPGIEEPKEPTETIVIPDITINIPEQPKATTIVIPDTPIDTSVTASMEDKIRDFKEKAIDAALVFINQDVRFAEVKEFKDMVAIVDSIDNSLRKPGLNNGPTINILVQNLAERYQDDC